MTAGLISLAGVDPAERTFWRPAAWWWSSAAARLRLLSRIPFAPAGEICVCDITGGDFEVSGPTISHHLKVLREAGLIDGERRGTWVYYSPVPANLRQLAGLLDAPAAARV